MHHTQVPIVTLLQPGWEIQFVLNSLNTVHELKKFVTLILVQSSKLFHFVDFFLLVAAYYWNK